MGQFKKPEVRSAILNSAMRLFSRKGYAGTTLSEIARGADISTANIYVYFGSKLEVLYAIYDPWIRERLFVLETEMSAAKGARQKLRLLLRALWRDMPTEKNGLVNNIMQAISSAGPRDNYKPATLKWTVAQLDRMLRDALPLSRRKMMSRGRIAYVLIMAYDGYTISHHVHAKLHPSDATIEAVVSMLLGQSEN